MNSIVSNFWTFFDKHKTNLIYTALAIMICLHLSIQLKYQFNYPCNADDVYICLKDLNSYIVGDVSWYEYLIMRKNNNPTLVQRGIALVQYQITGNVNFRWHPFIGNLFFIAFVVFFTLRNKSKRLAFLLPIVLLCPIANSIYWSSAASTYVFPVILLYLIMVLIHEKRKWGVFLVFLLLPILTYSFSVGFISLVVLLMYLWFYVFISQISWQKAGLYSIGITICLIHFFMGNHIDSGAAVTTFNFKVIGFSLAFLSSWMKYLFSPEYWLPAILSSLLFGLISLYIIWTKKNDQEIIRYMAILLMLLVTGLAAGYGRCRYDFLCTPMAERYEIYGVIFIAVVVLLLSEYRKLSFIVMIGILSISFFKYRVNDNILSRECHRKSIEATRGVVFGDYPIAAFSQDYRIIANRSYLESLSEGIVQPFVDLRELEYLNEIAGLERVKMDVLEHRQKGSWGFIRFEKDETVFSNYYLKKKRGYLKLDVSCNPKNENQCFCIIPKTRKNQIKVYGSN